MKDLVFFDQLRVDLSKKRRKAFGFVAMINVLVILALATMLYTLMTFRSMELHRRSDMLNAQISSLESVTPLDYSQVLNEVNRRTTELVARLEAVYISFLQNQKFHTDYVDDMLHTIRPQAVTVSSLHYSGGEFSISVSGTEELSVAEYAARLRRAGYILDVVYSGVDSSGEDYGTILTISTRSVQEYEQAD